MQRCALLPAGKDDHFRRGQVLIYERRIAAEIVDDEPRVATCGSEFAESSPSGGRCCLIPARGLCPVFRHERGFAERRERPVALTARLF
jgi:hypothetical protein